MRLLRISKQRYEEYRQNCETDGINPDPESDFRLPAGDPKAMRFWRDPKDNRLRAVAPWLDADGLLT